MWRKYINRFIGECQPLFLTKPQKHTGVGKHTDTNLQKTWESGTNKNMQFFYWAFANYCRMQILTNTHKLCCRIICTKDLASETSSSSVPTPISILSPSLWPRRWWKWGWDDGRQTEVWQSKKGEKKSHKWGKTNIEGSMQEVKSYGANL